MGGRRGTLEERFWRHVDRGAPKDCWLWRAATNGVGYGTINSGGERPAKMVLAHRLSFEINYGPIPAGLFVCHRCDVPACVNPAHLFLGTTRDNALDMVRKGRARPGRQIGEGNGCAKLTEDQVRQIRVAQGRVEDIGAQFGVSGQMVSRIRRRQNWSHVE